MSVIALFVALVIVIILLAILAGVAWARSSVWRARSELHQAGRMDAQDALAALRQQHVEELAQLHEHYGRTFSRTVSTAMLGGVAPGTPAVVSAAPDDAELRARREIAEDVIDRGIEHLRERYRKRGINHMSDDDLRAEAERIIRSQGIMGEIG